MVNAAGAVLCPHADSRVPEGPTAGSAPVAPDRPRTTVYVNGGAGTMGLCLECKRTMERLVRTAANLSDVTAVLLRLGYDRADAARFHADMAPRGPVRLWRRIVNRALVHLVPAPAREATA